MTTTITAMAHPGNDDDDDDFGTGGDMGTG